MAKQLLHAYVSIFSFVEIHLMICKSTTEFLFLGEELEKEFKQIKKKEDIDIYLQHIRYTNIEHDDILL